ncbi:Tryptophan 2,3-dioxygenase, partial [Frankliniella fusca]
MCLLILVVDAVRGVLLICENGYKLGSHFYHLGDGRFAYHVSYETWSSIYFKCVLYERGCRGRAILKQGGTFSETQGHNHPPDPNFVGERHFRANLLEDIENNVRFVGYQEIFDQFRSDQRYMLWHRSPILKCVMVLSKYCGLYTRRVRSKMTLRRLRSTMYNTRMKKYPNLPYTMRELTRVLLQHSNISQTIDDAENLYAGSVTATDASHHIALFSPRVLRFMSNIRIVHSDGTFGSRPALPASSQLFVLVTRWRNCAIPLGCFLMESRTKSAYDAVFQLLKELAPNFRPNVIMSDWEYAQQAAWQEAFPNAELHGCLWHLCRAFVRKVKKLKLLRFRNELPTLLDYVRKATAISLLPRQFFAPGLAVLRAGSLEEDQLLAYLLRPFFQCVEDKWINNRNRNRWMSLFNSEYRTNNACETVNRMLRRKTGAYRPNVFLFIQAWATLEHNASLDSELLGGGGDARRTRRWRSVWTDQQLKAEGSPTRLSRVRTIIYYGYYGYYEYYGYYGYYEVL